eukprot:CAMPEP_0197238478 /NCGR_PEP_ID=MMETSP1429-20130617/4960_1 /TAXON_ID=49237 /ORGANISM="Chaetoceros  sp., Strain UNC1202" /LENGTH=54 /DNA_ID=CAMNT_0042697639 /DNA_START=39 /DNA_END=200 /DNA_ORIENTATION=-
MRLSIPSASLSALGMIVLPTAIFTLAPSGMVNGASSAVRSSAMSVAAFLIPLLE